MYVAQVIVQVITMSKTDDSGKDEEAFLGAQARSDVQHSRFPTWFSGFMMDHSNRNSTQKATNVSD